MRDENYIEYRKVPSGGIDKWLVDSYEEEEKDAKLFLASLAFVQTLDRLGIIKVSPLWAAKSHNIITIVVDDVIYYELIEDWNRRF